MKIAIMQPYFIPYAGYFRLFCAADLFVIYDCVQFPRRSWLHRNQLYTQAKQLEWLTLPLQKQPMDTLIKNLAFRQTPPSEWLDMLNKFPTFKIIREKYADLFSTITDLNKTPLNYIVDCLKKTCLILNLPFNVIFSHELDIPKDIKGQDRILAIAKHLQATDYINSPGGRSLYNESDFLHHNIKLHFLPEYKGDFHSIIQCLANDEPSTLRNILFSQSAI
jgi:hypothetical protein